MTADREPQTEADKLRLAARPYFGLSAMVERALAEARADALRKVQDALDILWPGGGFDVGAFGRGQALAVVDRLLAEGEADR